MSFHIHFFFYYYFRELSVCNNKMVANSLVPVALLAKLNTMYAPHYMVNIFNIQCNYCHFSIDDSCLHVFMFSRFHVAAFRFLYFLNWLFDCIFRIFVRLLLRYWLYFILWHICLFTHSPVFATILICDSNCHW